jgi:hypothetical protein
MGDHTGNFNTNGFATPERFELHMKDRFLVAFGESLETAEAAWLAMLRNSTAPR